MRSSGHKWLWSQEGYTNCRKCGKRYVDDSLGVCQSPKQLQLEICHPDNTIRYYTINSSEGWRLDAGTQMLVIGKGIGRTLIPYVQIVSLRIVEA